MTSIYGLTTPTSANDVSQPSKINTVSFSYIPDPYYPVGADCVLYHAYWDGTAIDHSPALNDGTLVGGATSGVSGVILDGSTGRVTLASDIGGAGNYTYTVIMWFNRSSLKGGDSQVPLGHDSDSYSFYIRNAGYEEFNWYGSSWSFACGDAADQWECSIITVEHATLQANLYFNSVITVDSPKAKAAGTYGIFGVVGSYAAGASYTFMGTIGEILIFNTVWNQAKVTDYFNATKARYGL